MRAAGETFSVFFVAILYILSQLGKKYAYFVLIGEKICIFPPLFIPRPRRPLLLPPLPRLLPLPRPLPLPLPRPLPRLLRFLFWKRLTFLEELVAGAQAFTASSAVSDSITARTYSHTSSLLMILRLGVSGARGPLLMHRPLRCTATRRVAGLPSSLGSLLRALSTRPAMLSISPVLK